MVARLFIKFLDPAKASCKRYEDEHRQYREQRSERYYLARQHLAPFAADAQSERYAEEQEVRAKGALYHNAASLGVFDEERNDNEKQSAQKAGADANLKYELEIEDLEDVCRGYVIEKQHRQKTLEANVVCYLEKMLVPELDTGQHVAQNYQNKDRNDNVRRKNKISSHKTSLYYILHHIITLKQYKNK